jgi:hypothetical protein
MTPEQIEEAKNIALTIYHEIDYRHTWVGLVKDVTPETWPELPAAYSEVTVTIQPEFKGGYAFLYVPMLDRLYMQVSEWKTESTRLEI